MILRNETRRDFMMCLSQKIFNPSFACCLSIMIAKLILVSRMNSRKGPERLTVYDLVSPILSSEPQLPPFMYWHCLYSLKIEPQDVFQRQYSLVSLTKSCIKSSDH